MTEQRTRARRSTVALKYLMAGTGLLMIAFLLAHMYGNLKVFTGQRAFDAYGEHLRTIGEPILPRSGFLWVTRAVMLSALLGHIYAAVSLWRRDRLAAGGGLRHPRYQSGRARRGVQRSYASFTLRWGGVVIALFIVYHLLHLSADNIVHPGGASNSSYQRLVNGFSIWWVTLSYIVALAAVGFHLRHGMWSALTTLGANTGPRRGRNLNRLATGIALLITVGFLLPPLAVQFGIVS
jgi:succinate dehydrogenase / fumarate reductase cytochrome b subunit